MAGTTPPEARLIGERERFAVAAKKAGRAIWVHGLSLTMSTIAAGFNFASKLR